MRLYALGTAQDVRGLSLAGVPGRVCEDARALERELLRAGSDEGVGLLLLSKATAALSPAAVEAFAQRARPPSLLVLPEPAAPGVRAPQSGLPWEAPP